MSYLRVTRTPLVRKMPLGMYLYVPSHSRLETYSPVMEIDESTLSLLGLCDGTGTREDILECLSEESGNPIGEFQDDLDEFISYLVGEGVLEWVEEPEYVEPLYRGDRPFRILIEVTSACNHRCPFCSTNRETDRNELTLDDVIPLIKYVKEFRPSLFTISGGEPLLKKDIVLYMVEQLSPVKEIGLYILTNGTVVTRDYAQELYDAGLRFARVSVDGHTEELYDNIRGKKGAFRRMVQGIKYLRDVGIHVAAVSMVSKLNSSYAREIKEFSIQIADNYISGFDYLCGQGVGSDFLLNPEERMDMRMLDLGPGEIETGVFPQNRCHVGEILYIAADGDIFPCLYMNFPEFKLGNIREDDIREIYRSEIMQELLRLTVNDIEQCRECDYRYYCRGGCRGHAYGVSSSLYSPDPLDCKTFKAVARRILEHGEANTQRLMKELIESTRNSG